MTVTDLFAGMGGWSVACADLGLDELGIEWNDDACATRETAGLKTLKANVATLDPAEFPCDGLIASPPCQDFSVAGKGAGRTGHRGRLVDEVVRWVDVLRPRWVACEQVPPVLPIWQEFAHRFEQWGYRCWTGLLSAECYGVPQTRERAILMASLDGPVMSPEPTHQAYRHGEPAAAQHGLFGDLLPWVSMAEALGWKDDVLLRTRGVNGSEEDVISSRNPSRTVTGKTDSWVVDRRTNSAGPNGTTVPTEMRDCDTPAPTVDTQAGSRWTLRAGSTSHAAVRRALAPAPTILGNIGKNNGWQWERPATKIAGDPRCFAPGEHKKAGSEHQPGRSENAIKLTVPEGLTLQGFPPDYPVQGTKTAQWLQVGNAIPPPLAKAILAQLVRADEAAA